MAHRVSGALAVVRDSTGQSRYYYRGAVLPDGLPSEEVDRLVAVGLVEEVEQTQRAEAPVADDGTAADEGSGTGDTGTAASSTDTVAPAGQDDEPERPPKVAAKGVWVDYAVELHDRSDGARGLDRERAEAMNKDELVDALNRQG